MNKRSKPIRYMGRDVRLFIGGIEFKPVTAIHYDAPHRSRWSRFIAWVRRMLRA